MKEHISEPYYLFFHKMIENGELTVEELKRYYTAYYAFVNNMFPWEGIITARMQELCQAERNDPEGIREVRDLFRTHFYEEAGHEELLADFCERALKLDRVRDLYLPSLDTGEYYLKTSHDFFKKIYSENNFTDAAVLMFAERDLPRPHRRIRRGLKNAYGFRDKDITYFDVHSYIDIYHERYGQYIIAKHATTKKLQESVVKLFEQITLARYESEKQFYTTLKASKR
jgi:pyrroloquinoline quinone (PQQ) biosynthesis protein C